MFQPQRDPHQAGEKTCNKLLSGAAVTESTRSERYCLGDNRMGGDQRGRSSEINTRVVFEEQTKLIG
jgi:hypothetical protein